MKRRAIIIGAPDVDLPGVHTDMSNYENFLLSPVGGYWSKHEITKMESPSSAQVKVALAGLQIVDYSLVVFAGHGAYMKNTEATVVKVNPREFMNVDELKTGAARRLLIVDACRNHTREGLEEAVAMHKAAFESVGAGDICRRVFDSHLEKCPPGFAALYGCSDDESSGETRRNGGIFSYALMNVSRKWGEQSGQRESVLTIDKAFEAARTIVERQSDDEQHPDYHMPRSTPRFPFAVRADGNALFG